MVVRACGSGGPLPFRVWRKENGRFIRGFEASASVGRLSKCRGRDRARGIELCDRRPERCVRVGPNAGRVGGRTATRNVPWHGRADDSDDESASVHACRRVLHRRRRLQLPDQLRSQLAIGPGPRGPVGPDQHEPSDMGISSHSQRVLRRPAHVHCGRAGASRRLRHESSRHGGRRQVHLRLRQEKPEPDLVLRSVHRACRTRRHDPGDRPVLRPDRLRQPVRRRVVEHHVRPDPPAIYLVARRSRRQGRLGERVADRLRAVHGPTRRDDVCDGHPAAAHLGPQPDLAREGSRGPTSLPGHDLLRIVHRVGGDGPRPHAREDRYGDWPVPSRLHRVPGRQARNHPAIRRRWVRSRASHQRPPGRPAGVLRFDFESSVEARPFEPDLAEPSRAHCDPHGDQPHEDDQGSVERPRHAGGHADASVFAVVVRHAAVQFGRQERGRKSVRLPSLHFDRPRAVPRGRRRGCGSEDDVGQRGLGIRLCNRQSSDGHGIPAVQGWEDGATELPVLDL